MKEVDHTPSAHTPHFELRTRLSLARYLFLLEIAAHQAEAWDSSCFVLFLLSVL